MLVRQQLQNATGSLAGTTHLTDLGLNRLVKLLSSIMRPKLMTASGHSHFPCRHKHQNQISNISETNLEGWQVNQGTKLNHATQTDDTFKATPNFCEKYNGHYLRRRTPVRLELGVAVKGTHLCYKTGAGDASRPRTRAQYGGPSRSYSI